jgi:hypothetical protein
MQVAFQNENVLEKNISGATKVAQNYGINDSQLNFRTSQANFKSHKIENENYGNRRIFSPYLSPSSVVVENMSKTGNAIDPIYMHNIARTKYFNISKPDKPSEHVKVNMFA